MYTLFGNSQSTTLSRVIFCFLELGLEHEKDFTIKILPWSVVSTDEYSKHHPFKQLPYMVDEEKGIELYESRSMIKYAAAKVNSPLHVTSDPVSAARYETACCIELANFTPSAEGLIWELSVKPAVTGEGPTAEVVKHMSWDLNQRLEGYERLLSRQPYLAGEELTLADLFHMPNGLQVLQVKQAQALVNADGKSPNLAKWWKAISERPTWAQTEKIMAGLAAAE